MSPARVDHPLPLRERLIPLLADGKFHSGERLAGALGVSRAAVWKALNGLEALGVELERVSKRGYRLVQGVELLEAEAIEASLSGQARRAVRRLEVAAQVDSTNARLLAVKDLSAGQSDVCLAEYQTAGRGRRGRSWIAPYGGSLCLSVSWLFPEMPAQLGTLSLAAGVAVLRALRSFDAQGVALKGLALKWPNDVLLAGRKLGGILTEMRTEAAGPAYAVIGIGLNVRLPAAARAAIRGEAGLEAAALDDALAGRGVGRNALAAAIVEQSIAALLEFQHSGFRSFAREWRDADALLGAPAQVLLHEEVHRGVARGIDDDGALLLETPRQMMRFNSGEVSLRPALRESFT